MRIESSGMLSGKNSRALLRALAAAAILCCAAMAWPAGAGAARHAKAKAAEAASAAPSADAGVSAALAQVVYPLDEKPSAAGYRCIFLGNSFFINRDGYLITAAHVVSWFRDGGRPYILAGPAGGPRRLVAAEIVAADWQHDVAVLRATPNPFAENNGGDFAYLKLAAGRPQQGSAVVEASLLSTDVENTYSSDAPVKAISSGEVLRYQLYQEDGSAGGGSELVLVSSPVAPGQSGSPLVAADSQGVVGVIVGRWLHPAMMPAAADGADAGKRLILSPGAALRIDYAIRLLDLQHVAWQAAPGSPSVLEAEAFAPLPEIAAQAAQMPQAGAPDAQPTAAQAAGQAPAPPAAAVAQAPAAPPAPPAAPAAAVPPQAAAAAPQQQAGYAPPMPVSVTGTYYPPDVQLGGEVLLDAQVDTDGKLSDVNVVSGKPSYVRAALSAIDAWQFQPAQWNGQNVEARIGIVFQFPQSFLPPITSGERQYEEFAPGAADRGALPVQTEEAVYPFNSVVNGSVVLYEAVDAQGQVTSGSVLAGVDALTQPAIDASYGWRFAPGKRGGENADSTVIVVTTFRRPESR